MEELVNTSSETQLSPQIVNPETAQTQDVNAVFGLHKIVDGLCANQLHPDTAVVQVRYSGPFASVPVGPRRLKTEVLATGWSLQPNEADTEYQRLLEPTWTRRMLTADGEMLDITINYPDGESELGGKIRNVSRYTARKIGEQLSDFMSDHPTVRLVAPCADVHFDAVPLSDVSSANRTRLARLVLLADTV